MRFLERDSLVPTPTLPHYSSPQTLGEWQENSDSITSGSYQIEPLTPENFDILAAEFDDLSLDQIAGYKTLVQQGNTKLFISYRQGRVVGGAVVVIYAIPLIGRGVVNVRFGPFWRRRHCPVDPSNYLATIAQMKAEFVEKQGHMLTILPRPNQQYQEIESDLLFSCGFTQREPTAASSRYVVNLELSAEEQMKSLGQKWRYNLRKALKNNLVIERDDGPGGQDAFASVHSSMLSRKQINLVDQLEVVPLMCQRVPEVLKPRTYLAWQGDEVVAGAVAAPLGDTVHYLYGATADKGLPLRASYALHWHIVNEFSAESFKYYDLGGSSQFGGLRQFKSGLSGQAGSETQIPMEHDYCDNPIGRLSGRTLHSLRYLKGKAVRLRNDRFSKKAA